MAGPADGKLERFHRILLEEWAHTRPWHTDHQRTRAYDRFIHFFNHYRPHGAFSRHTPTQTLRDNSPTNTARLRLSFSLESKPGWKAVAWVLLFPLVDVGDV